MSLRFHPLPDRFRLAAVAVTLSLGALTLPAACSSSPEFDGGNGAACSDSSDCADDEFCNAARECEGQCKTCGNDCVATEDCPTGQFCDRFRGCQSECSPGEEGKEPCSSNQVCSSDGECVGKNDVIAPIGGGGAGGSVNDDCIDQDIIFEQQTPNVVLLIDQSGSMNDEEDRPGPNTRNFGEAVDQAISDGTYTPWDCTGREDWRWSVVRNVLLHPDDGVVKPLEDKVRFGLALYSSRGGFDGGTCPSLTEVGLDFDTHQAMLDEFECGQLIRDTPTRESLSAVANQLAGMDLEGPKVIVLATDGEPDNCTCPNWDNGAGPTCADNPGNQVMRGGTSMSPAEAEQYDVIREAQRIHDELGVTVEVINVSNPGNTTLAQHLDQVAQFGGAASGASIPGFDPGALSTAFQTIVDGVRSCAIDLNGRIGTGKETTGTVTLDGTDLVFGDDDGWKLNTPSQIELVGNACETIKTGDHDIDINFPCGSFTVNPR